MAGSEKLKKQIANMRSHDEKFPKSVAPVIYDSPRFSQDQLNGFSKKLFEDGYVVIPDFVEERLCREGAAEITARLEENGILDQSKSLQQTLSSIPQPEQFIDGACVIMRASAAKGESYDTGMIIVLDPEKAAPSLLSFKDDPVVRAIAEAAKGAPLVHKNQVLYFNDSVTNPRGLHWDSVTMQFKAFLYLTDVDTNADGPYSFVRGTHATIRSREWNARFNEFRGHLPTDARLYPPHRLTRFIAKRGTLIISNQRGYHGGTPQRPGHRRIMLVQNYV